MPDSRSEGAPPKGLSRLARLLLFCLALPQAMAMGSPAPAQHNPWLALALVSNHPAPGRARMPLERVVVQLRHDYGNFSLARLSPAQESALREAGYEVRVFEDSDRIG